MVRYEDFYCNIVKGVCKRGSLKDCPKSLGKLALYCRHFVRKDDGGKPNDLIGRKV